MCPPLFPAEQPVFEVEGDSLESKSAEPEDAVEFVSRVGIDIRNRDVAGTEVGMAQRHAGTNPPGSGIPSKGDDRCIGNVLLITRDVQPVAKK